ncbi:hypothetical protein BDAP_000406 [Binucleata daphniae]
MVGLCFIRGSFADLINDGTNMPKILSNIMGDLDKNSVHKMLTKMNLLRNTMTGIYKLKTYSFLPPNLISRLSKGMAGYRYINAIYSTALENNREISNEARDSYKAVMEFRRKGIYMDVHPGFIDCEFKKVIPSLSKCLMNLLLDLYTDEKLSYVVKTKLINEIPKIDSSVNYASYLTTINFETATHKMNFECSLAFLTEKSEEDDDPVVKDNLKRKGF